MTTKRMKMPVSLWLKQPYPGITRPLRDGLLVLLVGTAVTVLLLLIQPFGLGDLPEPRARVFILAAGATATAIGLLNQLGLPRLLPSIFRESAWTIQRQIMFECWYLFTIAMGLLTAASLFGIAQLSWGQVGSYTLITSISGVFPLTLKILLTQVYLLKRNVAELKRVRFQPAAASPENRQIELFAETSDRLVLDSASILYISAEQNYCETWWMQDSQRHKHLFRQKIGALESQLHETAIKRTHRSYLVNLERVIDVSGNAQGYRLKLRDGEREIPLSRSFAAKVLPQIDYFS